MAVPRWGDGYWIERRDAAVNRLPDVLEKELILPTCSEPGWSLS
jgi:hypothetical protein